MPDLKQLREASGLCQFEVANAAGLNRTRLALAENGYIELSEREECAIRSVLVKAIQRRSRHLEEVLASASA